MRLIFSRDARGAATVSRPRPSTSSAPPAPMSEPRNCRFLMLPPSRCRNGGHCTAPAMGRSSRRTHGRNSAMWSRRRFLEIISAGPLVGGFTTASSMPAAAAPARRAGRDYFRELGVRPFINAAGTYTAMTASLMPPEVMAAINYASKQYVMLDELHDRVGEAVARLVRAE